MGEIILSIITSTCNRAELLNKNIQKMIKCHSKEVEYIIGDNASSDNTYEIMKQFEDSRITIFKNDINLGFENFWLLSSHARGKYFMFVNDRDYIEPWDIEKLCEELKNSQEVDFISNEKRNYEPGYYFWKDAIDIYFQSRHPGTLIYNNLFCKKYIDTGIIKEFLMNKNAEKANNYLVLMLLLNVKKVLLKSRNVINQPFNRERIAKVRKEYYRGSYVSLEYRIKEYDDWVSACQYYSHNERIKEILKGIYKDSFMTVTWEYYMSLKIPGFKQRTGMGKHSEKEWFLNGVEFYFHIINNKELLNFHIRKDITKITVKCFKEAVEKVMKY